MKRELNLIKIGKIVGVLLLIKSVMSIMVKQFLLGSNTFAADFLGVMGANSNNLLSSVLFAILGNVLSIVIALLLLEIFKSYNKVLANAFLSFTIIHFGASLMENNSVLSLLAMSNEYINNSNAYEGSFQALGSVLLGERWFKHLMALLISVIPLLLLFFQFFKYRLIPRFLSVWGILGAALLLVNVLLMIFNLDSSSLLMIPLGLAQIITAIWLIIRGFELKNNLV